ncbi:hypothetical protein [Cyclobacterium amurskyense]|nr:hypothetical protein [Cyclobacterium amurskyense]|tara:strand:+ start:13194 stop:13316 length:123 start_codon:yes stop_codon:yes gene_type:complete
MKTYVVFIPLVDFNFEELNGRKSRKAYLQISIPTMREKRL